MFPQQLGNEGARNDHALIDEKAEVSQPRLVGEVGGGNFFGGAPLDDAQYLIKLITCKPRVEKRLQPVERKMERVENEISRFVVRGGRAMPEEETCLIKAAHGKAKQVPQGTKLGFGLGEHGFRQRLIDFST